MHQSTRRSKPITPNGAHAAGHRPARRTTHRRGLRGEQHPRPGGELHRFYALLATTRYSIASARRRCHVACRAAPGIARPPFRYNPSAGFHRTGSARDRHGASLLIANNTPEPRQLHHIQIARRDRNIVHSIALYAAQHRPTRQTNDTPSPIPAKHAPLLVLGVATSTALTNQVRMQRKDRATTAGAPHRPPNKTLPGRG
jgi:hypothetical protein